MSDPMPAIRGILGMPAEPPLDAAHEIVWGFDRDTVTARAVCNDPDCVHREGDECAFVEWLDADWGMIPELCVGRETFEIGRTAVLPEWRGEDGVLWKRA